MTKLNCLPYGGLSGNWRRSMSEVTTRHCDYHECKAVIPDGHYYLDVGDSIKLTTGVEKAASATTGFSDDYCSIQCLVAALRTATKELGINLNKPPMEETHAEAT
jgi:hypothetical protein